MARATRDDLATAILGVVDKALHCVEAAGVGERTERDAFLEAVPPFETLAGLGEACHELAVVLFMHIEARRRDADLAGIAILERRACVGGFIGGERLNNIHR